MPKCPKCGSSAIGQYRMPTGPMWCISCNFRVNDKTAYPNPFIDSSQSQKQTRLEILQEFYDTVKVSEEICTKKLSELGEET